MTPGMDPADLRARAQRWMADDPDPATRAELFALLAQPDPEATDLGDRFAGPSRSARPGCAACSARGPTG